MNIAKSICKTLVAILLIAQMLPSFLSGTAEAEDAANLAQGKAVTVSSSSGATTVDGILAGIGWQPTLADRGDDNKVWVIVDLGAEQTFNKFQMIFNKNTSTFLTGYEVAISNNKTDWTNLYSKNLPTTTVETKVLETPETSRYVKVTFNYALCTTACASFQLIELQIFNLAAEENIPIPDDLESIFLTNAQGVAYPINTILELSKGETLDFKLRGRLSSGVEIDMDQITHVFTSTSNNAIIDPNKGELTANSAGASQIFAQVQPNGKPPIISDSVFVIIKDPNEFYAAQFVASTTLAHPRMTLEVGQPAMLMPGDVYPTVTVHANVTSSVNTAVYYEDNQIAAQLPADEFSAGQEKTLTIPGTADQSGQYEIRLTINEPGKAPVYDAFFFTAIDPATISADQSKIAFLNGQNKMVYIPDYKGNHIIDFSNSGYKGGGVKIPDVPVVKTIEPLMDQDNTAHIQAAINEISQLPLNETGFRGTLLLKKGTYSISDTIYIKDSGIVLRGEGDGPEGTLVYGTGTKRRNLIEIGNNNSLSIDNSSMVKISDLYVPSGSRTFHVENASAYNVNDTVMVRRIGNARWVSEIGMDQIFNLPGAPKTTQFTPFNLDFDRVITAVDKVNNLITVDAPIANAIDRKWGGGELRKYTDPGRIQNVGIEYMSADSAYDPSVISTAKDSQTIDPYYADEDHTERFVGFNSAKNGWVRNVSGYHLAYSLVRLNDKSKWITVQDSNVYDMISIITGSRRYAIQFSGQLNLAQRIHVETARHAFVTDARVPGPNVFLDSDSLKDYNTSEPHHRWSVGGLYDNVKAPIAIQDRAYVGDGHGWAGANYVTWNTEGNLVSQQPPTAQNYAIGHVGSKVSGFFPNGIDPRPRKDAYWDHIGQHVALVSLYKQQLVERLGEQALANISRDTTPPTIQASLPGAVYLTDLFTISAQVDDEQSGIKSVSYYLDDTPVQNPLIIKPLDLSIGEHVFRVVAKDNAGNEAIQRFPFKVIMGIDQLDELISISKEQEWIKNEGIYQSLMAMVQQVQKEENHDQVTSSLKAFENHVKAQSDKYIDAKLAKLLLDITASLLETR